MRGPIFCTTQQLHYNPFADTSDKKSIVHTLFSRESVGVCFYRRWFVCLSVTTITKKIVDGFVPDFMGRFLGEREDLVRVSIRSVEGREINDCLPVSYTHLTLPTILRV